MKIFSKKMQRKLFKIFRIIFLALVIAFAFLIFVYYLNYLFRPFCLKLGYTLCAAEGEDFYALYQAAYNFFHNIFIYGESASSHLVTPYFMPFRYFPASPFLIGWPFLLTNKPYLAYQIYLFFSLILHCLSVYSLYLIAKKFNANKIIFGLVILIWFLYFPLLSEWRMGQFDHLSGMFFLLTVVLILYHKKILSSISWIISLAFKPIPILCFLYFFKTKNKFALTLFSIFFIGLTGIYLLYHQLYNPQAISTFLKTIFALGERTGWQIHFIDNFGIPSLLGEIFFDHYKLIYKIISVVYPLSVLSFYFFVTLKLELKDHLVGISYLLFSLATVVIIHKELWEGWLNIWLPILCILFLMAKTKKERVFLLFNTLILGTPSLFYFYEISKTPFWRFLLIAEKAIPQLLIYLFLCLKLRGIILKQKFVKAINI